MPQRKKTGVFLVLLLCLAVMLGGCVIPRGSPDRTGKVQFSPDGKTVAYVWLDHLVGVPFVIPGVMAGLPGIVGNTAHVRWCEVASPDKQGSVRIDAVICGPNHDSLEGHVHLVFSPDSRHLAVVSPRRLFMIELSSGRHWQMTAKGEEVSSLAWLGNDEIAYAAHSQRDKDQGNSIRTFWRQKIHDLPQARIAVYRDEGILGAICNTVDWNLERWSPKGKHVIFASGATYAKRTLLDVDTGKARTIGRLEGSARMVSWKPDGSAVLCLAQSPSEWEAILVDPVTGKTRGFSEQFQKAFTTDYAPFLAPVWTPDGQYLVTAGIGEGRLIRLLPWVVVRVGKRLSERLDLRKPYPEIFALPIAGWLRAEAWNNDYYLVDYSGSRFRLLDNAPFWACSPNGQWAAEVGMDKKVIIRKLDLPSTQPASDKADK